MTARPGRGVRRAVTWKAWCDRCGLGWSGAERDMKSMAAFDLACHNIDVHGGSVGGDQ